MFALVSFFSLACWLFSRPPLFWRYRCYCCYCLVSSARTHTRRRTNRFVYLSVCLSVGRPAGQLVGGRGGMHIETNLTARLNSAEKKKDEETLRRSRHMSVRLCLAQSTTLCQEQSMPDEDGWWRLRAAISRPGYLPMPQAQRHALLFFLFGRMYVLTPTTAARMHCPALR